MVDKEAQLAIQDIQTQLSMMLGLVVRNVLEDHHAGTSPTSKTGDYSDVKVVSPYGEIPWNKLSRISDEEMERLNKEMRVALYKILNNVFKKSKRTKKEREELGWLVMCIPSYWELPQDLMKGGLK